MDTNKTSNSPGKFKLISHLLCPYVQRVVIALEEKQIPYERIDLDLTNKPDWFLTISPMGKTPVLLVDNIAIFESAVICEYLDDVSEQRMHPQDPLMRAQHRAWIEFSSATLNSIAGMYSAPDAIVLTAKIDELRSKFMQIEVHFTDQFDVQHEMKLNAQQASHLLIPAYFSGLNFSLVDAAFAPVFRYFEVFDANDDFEIFSHTPRVNAWRTALQNRRSVRNAVRSDYPDLLRDFLHNLLCKRNSELARRIMLEAA